MQCNNPHLSRPCGRPWCCRRHGCNGEPSVPSDVVDAIAVDLTCTYQVRGMFVTCLVQVKWRLSPLRCQWRRLAGGSFVLDRSPASGMWPRRISPVGPRMSPWPWPPQSGRLRCRFVRLLGRCRRSMVYPRARCPNQEPVARLLVWPSRIWMSDA
jgi:hypothetical protein